VDEKLTLGSLFDGSGGFPLGAILTGIEPLWASEVEPFPIRVTTKRFPNMKHYGDINKINGALLPPVDIITAGFCCQDLSVAGKRAGLQGERSGLFYQIPRIIKEMLTTTDNTYPKFAVLENVPGMYSSAGGADFQEVLNELIQIKDKTLSVPLPEKGKWSTSGEIVGDGFSVSWRTLDAQFWGVAQRRRRCYIVVDFTGERAGKILFDESRLRGHPPQGGFPWQTTAESIAVGSGSTVCILNDQGGSYMDVSENVTGTLRSQEHGHQPIVFEPGAASRVGGHCWQDEPTGALRADMSDNQLAVAIENHPADSRIKIDGSGTIQTLTERMGTGGGNVPLVMNERQYALTVGEDVANTLTGTDFKGTQSVFQPKTLKIRSGC
jgi:DNA-methyltransferase (dcm)